MSTVNLRVSFTKPTIGPSNYVSIGSEGWPTTFDRKQADIDLDRLMNKVCLDDALTNFQTQCDLALSKGKVGAAGWTEIVKYLGRLTSLHPDSVPCSAAIAFWAKLLDRQPRVLVQGNCE